MGCERQVMSTNRCMPRTKFHYEDIKMKLEARLSEESEPSLAKVRTVGAPVANFYEIEEELVAIAWNHPHTDVKDRARCPQPLAATLQQVCAEGHPYGVHLLRVVPCTNVNLFFFCSGTSFQFKLKA